MLSSPVVHARNIFFIFVFGLLSLFEFLHLGSVFDVDREHASSGVSYKKFPFPLIKANRGNLFLCKIPKNTLQRSSSSIPNLNALGVRSDKGEEHWIVQNIERCLLVSQVVCGRLIIVVENKFTASCNDSLWRTRDRKAVNFVKWAVESLNCSEGSHVPNSEHTGDVCRNHLVSSLQPFDSNQRVVVPLQHEDFLCHCWVPDVNVMICACTQNDSALSEPL